MSAEDMHEAARCQHVRLNGKQCKAPARRGTDYCLFHEKAHAAETNLTFPPVEDAATVQVATDQVLQALRDDMIDLRRASLLFSGLRIARANLKALGYELGDEQPMTKKEREEAEEENRPSLAEYLMQQFDETEAEEARAKGEPAPEPYDVAKGQAEGKSLEEMLIERLQLVPPEEPKPREPEWWEKMERPPAAKDQKSAVPPGLEKEGDAA